MHKNGKKMLEHMREVIEVVLGLGGVTVVSWWIPVVWQPSHLLFCAFFVVVFAIAVRYRALVAYSTSVLAAGIYGVLLWLRPEMRVQPGVLVLALEPFLLLVSGLLTSDLSRWQRQRMSALERDYACADEVLRRTQQSYQIAVKANEELERLVAGQAPSMARMSEKVMCLWTLEGAERYDAILDLVIYALEAQSCACYQWRHGLFHLSAARPGEGSTYAPLLNANDPLLARVLAQREVVTIHDFLVEERQLPPEVAVMAGPLLNQAGEIIGVVVIDRMPLLQFTPGTVRLLRTLLQMTSLALQTVPEPEQNQERYTDALASMAKEPVLPVISNSNSLIQ